MPLVIRPVMHFADISDERYWNKMQLGLVPLVYDISINVVNKKNRVASGR